MATTESSGAGWTPRFSNYEELRELVGRSGDLLEVTMYELRNAHGAGKLGVRVREEIQDQLAGVGLGFFPGADLPSYQEHSVRLYRRGTAVGNLVDAVLHPSARGDQLLLDSTSSTAADVLKQIRTLVCE